MKNKIVILTLSIGILGSSLIANSTMKCGSGMDMDKNIVKKEISSKCGADMKKRKIQKKKEVAGKCGMSHMKTNAGKCGGDE